MSKKKPEHVFFDTNVYINLLKNPAYQLRLEIFLQGAYLFVLNKIVLMELWAGVKNHTEENILKQHQKIIPAIGLDDDNFIQAGKILFQMAKEHRNEPLSRRRLTWDILIALSAKENNALLVTENQEDFRKIQNFLPFEFTSPAA